MATDIADFGWLDGTWERSTAHSSMGGIIAPTTLSASSTPNYEPTGAQTASVWAISASLAVGISGIVAPAKDPRKLTLMNVGSFPITLSQNDLASDAVNRILMPDATHILDSGEVLVLYYFPTLSRWMVGASSSTGNGAAIDATLRQTVALECAFNAGYTTGYSELTYNSGGEVINFDVWLTSAKTTKVFSKTLAYSGDELSQTVMTDETTGAILTTDYVWASETLSSVTKTVS